MNSFRFLLCALFLAGSFEGRAQSVYTIKDLGTLGGAESMGIAINNNDQVAGTSLLGTDDAFQNAFVSGLEGALPLRSLGTLGGAESLASGINSSGRVAGSALDQNGLYRAFLSGANGGLLTNLGTLGGTNSFAYSVNGAGQVAGYSLLATGSANHAFLSAGNGGALADLGTLPGGVSSFGMGVNASGQVAGYSGTMSGFNRAFLSDPSGGALRDLGTLGGRFSFGFAVNDAGQVAGRSEPSNLLGQHAFRSGPNGGVLSDLGTLGGFSSYAEGINVSGAVVGTSYLSDNGTLHAFLYTTANGMKDLNQLIPAGSGWVLNDARAINDRGHITGSGMRNGDSHPRAFLLTPILSSVRITSIVRLSNGHVLLAAIGGASQSYGLETAAHLTDDFVRIATVTAGGDGLLQFEDTEPPARSGFYRFTGP